MTKRSMARRVLPAIACVGAVAILIWWVPFAAFHLLPPDWTGEADRLAAALHVASGMRIAEIGAGSGALSLGIARRVGPAGVVYATELSASRRQQIASAAAEARLENIVVVAAGQRDTGLGEECFPAIYMRNVFHHIDAPESFAVQLRRALRAGGRLAVIDFQPGSIFHLTPDHGAESNHTIRLFAAAGFQLEEHRSNWGGRTYLALFRAEG